MQEATRAIILNADPGPVTRTQVSGILRREGVDVIEVGSAEECLRRAAEVSPDIVVIAGSLDDAESLCREIGVQPGVLRLVRDAPPDAANWGAELYLSGPLDPAALRSAVRTLLRIGSAERDCEDARKNLLAAQQEINALISRTGHDFTETIRAISTLLEMIRLGGEHRLTSNETGYMVHVAGVVDRSRHLVQSLMSYSQIAREPATLRRNVNLHGAVLAAESQLRREFDESGATVQGESLPTVYGNPARLQQLMACLLSNAIKYRAPGVKPVISIRADPAPAGWRISVQDNGIGIDPEYHENIFAPFHRLHGREIPGTGMGLALCRRIVGVTGGDMWVESKSGHGAKFLFTLPAASDRAGE